MSNNQRKPGTLSPEHAPGHARKALRELHADELEEAHGGDGGWAAWIWGSSPDNQCDANSDAQQCPPMSPNDPNTACDDNFCFQGDGLGDGQ